MPSTRTPALRRLSRAALRCSFLALLVLSSALGRDRGRPADRDATASAPGDFDYYLMSLSWSPTYCETHPEEREQCGTMGFGFVLHGLWPQNRNGSYPEHCRSDAQPDAATIRRTLAFMPSEKLIVHEWRTHGACTGLDPRAYFDLADRAFASVRIPSALIAPQSAPQLSADEVGRAFIEANPGMGRDMLAVTCSRAELAEVRVCLSRELAPTRCGRRVESQCRPGVLTIPAAR